MESYLIDWFSVIVRWLHLITGIAWIGASLHFAWLDNSLDEPDPDKKALGIKGELWAIHGGGIYNFNKYTLAPTTWPSLLHWSKWEAYSTWLTGTLLMVAVYYFQSQTYLVGFEKWVSDPNVAIIASLGYVLSGLVVYELMVRSPLRQQTNVFVVVLALFIVAQSWLATKLFSDRAAFLHVGALMGTIMAGNVFLGIIPSQKRFVAAVQAAEQPDANDAAFAKQRSMHNNYFTLPVLFCMISNHYPFLYGHAYNWLILIAIIGITAYARHFFNLKNQGTLRYGIMLRAVLAFFVLASWLGYERFQQMQPVETIVSQVNGDVDVSLADEDGHNNLVTNTEIGAASNFDDEAALQLIATHCQVCHSVTPTQPGFAAPPAGILMDDPVVIKKSAEQMLTAVRTNYMPLGNLTRMSKDERALLLVWLESTKAD